MSLCRTPTFFLSLSYERERKREREREREPLTFLRGKCEPSARSVCEKSRRESDFELGGFICGGGECVAGGIGFVNFPGMQGVGEG